MNPASFTVSCWAMYDGGYVGGDEFSATIFSKLISNESGLTGWCLGVNENGQYFFSTDRSYGDSLYQYDFDPHAVWVHLAGTYNVDTNVIRFYVNGIEVAGSPQTIIVPFTGNNARIYVSGWTASDNPIDINDHFEEFSGYVYDCRLYNRALTTGEVKAIWSPDTRYELFNPVLTVSSKKNDGVDVNYGLLAAGSASSNRILVPIHSGGALVGSSGSLLVRHIPSVSGGAVCGSTASNVRIAWPRVTGGAVAAGTARNYLFDIAAGSGGAVCGGTATISVISGQMPASGVKCGGYGRLSWNYTASGGARAGGLSNPDGDTSSFYVGSGGARVGGTPIMTCQYNTFGRNGAKASGYGLRSWYYTSDTGVKVGGPPLIYVVYKIPPISGGMRAGGTSRNYLFDIQCGTGGAVITGRVVKVFIYRPNLPKAGVCLGGTASSFGFHDFNFTATGSVVLSGNTLTGPDFPYTGQGATVVTSGDADTEITEKIYDHHVSDPATSVVYLSGIVEEGVDFHHHLSTGGIVISGDSDFIQLNNDRNCGSTSFGCINPFPSPYKECYTSRYYRPVKHRAIPRSGSKRGAYLPNITVCQQKPYLPIPDVAPKT
jgi:hypothetical protein